MSSKDTLRAILLKQKEEAESEDRRRTIVAWHYQVIDLMCEIKGWLRPFAAEKLLASTFDHRMTAEKLLTSIFMTELDDPDNPGQSLRITTPHGHTINVVPVSRLVVGGVGRVDIVFGAERARLLQVEPNVWKIVCGLCHETPLGFKLESFTEDSFFGILHDWLKDFDEPSYT